ncbi:fibroblast growth factor receptor 3-like isoform X1 [Montipora foliosa]|uniref:fibroblast growth factor receptor 3-like isoform X1 n=1 Tax=Montipora foliosa TaxID=591990 RepID=UPI0035F11FB9
MFLSALAFIPISLVFLCQARSEPCPVPVIRNKGDKIEVVSIGESMDAKLTCVVKNTENYKPTVSWEKDNKTLHPANHQRMRLKANKYLKIKKARKEDEGLYTCVAENTCGGRNTLTLRLFVEGPTLDPKRNSTPAAPEFTVSEEKRRRNLLAVPVGNTVKMDCSASGFPRPTVVWYKDGVIFQARKGGSRLYIGEFTTVVTIRDVVPSDSGFYTCNVSNAHGWINHSYRVDVHERVRAKPVVLEMENVTVMEGENATLLCKALSDSMPHFQWLRWLAPPTNASGNISNPSYEVIKQNVQGGNNHLLVPHGDTSKLEFHGVKLTLVNVTKKDEGKYTCIVGNAVGYTVKRAYIFVRESSEVALSQETSTSVSNNTSPLTDVNHFQAVGISAVPSSRKKIFIAIAVGFGFLTVAGVGLLLFCYRRKLKSSKATNYGIVYKAEAKETELQYRAHDPSLGGSSSSYCSTVPLIRNRSLRSRLGSNLTQVSEVEMPMDEKWEIDRENINMLGVLGEGAFGRVMKAEILGLPNMPFKFDVAVKMLKEDATDHEFADLVSEMETMKTIGKHKNIINLIGACTQGGPLYVVVEYAPNGNLRQFLRDRRPTREYTTTLTLADLVSFGYQVVRGMEYLSSKKCIHRDLAARNILVGEENTLKIADFGLARDVHQIDYYRKTTDGRLPVKWMALEALFDRVYTIQSDVWAFGILVWEIVTFGGSPYPSVPIENLFELLKFGYRMEKPVNCPDNMYEIMLRCWQDSPSQRPTFTELVKEFDAMLMSLSDKEYIDLEASQISSMEPQTPTSSEAPSTPRHSVATEHDTESDDRDNDNVFVDNSNDIWESRRHELPYHVRQPENALDITRSLFQSEEQIERNHARHKSSLGADENKKKSSFATFRSPIQSDV